jgi:predicted branched-subunit amino acid permease
MLDASDQERLREIEAHLLVDDPVFVARMRGEDHATPRHRPFGLLVVAGVWLLWVAALLAGAVLGWPALAAGAALLLVAGTATWQLRRHQQRHAPFTAG